MTIKDAFTSYYPQLLVIVGAIGSLLFYFIKRRYDLSSKKAEIKFGLFQEHKLLAIQEFISRYRDLGQIYSDTSYHKVVRHEYSAAEMDERFRPPINRLHSSYSTLFLYLDRAQLEVFEKLYKSAMSINQLFTTYYFEANPTAYGKETSDLGMHVASFQSEGEKLLDEVGAFTRILLSLFTK